MTRRGRWATFAAIAAVAGVLLVGFSALRGGDTAGVALADAAARIEGESMRIRIAMDLEDSSGKYSITAEGVSSEDGSRGAFDMRVALAGEEPVDMRIRVVQDDVWSRVEQFRDVMPDGKQWIHGRDTTLPAQGLTPSQFVEFLTDADDVEEVGEARVLGQTTTHYRGMIDVEEFAEELGDEAQARLEALIANENVPEGSKLGAPVEAWISEEGLPIRLRIDARSAKDAIDMTTDVLEYGVPVEVEPPPASKVIEEAEFDRLIEE